MNEVVPVSPVKNQETEIRQKFEADLKKQLTTKRVVVVAGVVASLAVLLPLAVFIAQAVAALAAAGVLAVGGLVAWKMLPRWIRTIEHREIERNQAEMNRHLAALKNEARKNPIEQAQNEYLRRSRQYETFKAALEQIGGQVASFRSKLEKTKREKPSYDLRQETAALEKMQQFYTSRVERLKAAFRSLQLFKEKIEEAQTKWEFQLQANAAIRAMNATDQEAKMAEILTAVAFDTVQTEFDSVFARLDVDAAEINDTKALEFAPGVTIDVSAVHIGDRAEPVLVQLNAPAAKTSQARS